MHTFNGAGLNLFILVFFILFVGNPVFSQQLTIPDSLKNVLDAREQAMFTMITEGDKAEAEKMIADDYITINADGVMEGKENTIKTLGKFKGSVSKISDKVYRVYGDVAIINGRAKFYVKQLLVAEIFYTEIWKMQAGKWKFTGWQGTITGTPAYYPIIATIIVMLLLYGLPGLIKIRRSRQARRVI